MNLLAKTETSGALNWYKTPSKSVSTITNVQLEQTLTIIRGNQVSKPTAPNSRDRTFDAR